MSTRLIGRECAHIGNSLDDIVESGGIVRNTNDLVLELESIVLFQDQSHHSTPISRHVDLVELDRGGDISIRSKSRELGKNSSRCQYQS